MTTDLMTRRVRRETSVIDSTRGGRRVLLIELTEGGKLVRLKPKGLRKWWTIDIASVYRLAVMSEAKAILAAKRAEKAERRKARRA